MRIELLLEKIKKVQRQNMWHFGNKVLYTMCKKSPLHINEGEIVGKVWLIGRSYAAAIERKANSKYKGDNFYRYEVAEKIKAVGSELDSRITSLREQPKVTKELLGEILETHNFLINVFNNISGMDNRSLASKYLHFHVPNIFYIYDTRAVRGVTKMKTLDRLLKKELLTYDCDKIYADFVSKIYPLNVKIFEQYGIWLTPRQIDTLILDTD